MSGTTFKNDLYHKYGKRYYQGEMIVVKPKDDNSHFLYLVIFKENNNCNLYSFILDYF